jgi:hypothetical protein
MLIYTPVLLPRIQYIANWLGIYWFKMPINVVTHISSICNNEQVINYSNNPIDHHNSVWIKPHGLLAQTGIKEQEIVVKHQDQLPYFFGTNGDFEFDILALSFYLIQRYEEYLPFTADNYGRYPHTDSVAYKNNFLHLPLVDIWLQKFAAKYAITTTNNQFEYLPTYDIDNAFKIIGKAPFKKMAIVLKSALQNSNFKAKLHTLFTNTKDPFDVFEELENMHELYHLKPTYFVLAAAKNGLYDTHILPTKLPMQALIRRINTCANIGIHPSWQSGDHPNLIATEINTIATITKQKITSSRQHYLRMLLPQTYNQLIAQGIKKDYSMGYGSYNGFRAATCKPYNWYNITTEQQTDLQIIPFCFMDATSIYHLKHSTSSAFEQLITYYTCIKNVGGTMVTIFHNDFLGRQPKGNKWMQLYQQFIHYINKTKV